jgi:thioredoxin reductase
MSTPIESLPVVVIGAGPVGLAAAAHLAELGLDFRVLEAGPETGSSIRSWGHVRVFSPWHYNIDMAARRLLQADGWSAPHPDDLPTGHELIDAYLTPLAKHRAIAPHLAFGSRVIAIGRSGIDRVRTEGRKDAPFLVRMADAESVRQIAARAVIDASGTYQNPNVLGASGLAATGESEAASCITSALPDVLGAHRGRFAGKHTLVAGAGHSAANTLLALADLAGAAPGTLITWVLRGADATRAYGGGAADVLPARGSLGARLRTLVDTGKIRVLTEFGIERLDMNDDRVTVTAADGRSVDADVIVSATGFRPDHSIAAELRLDLDPVFGAPRALAPLIDPVEHSCGTVPPHGVAELAHPEAGYYAVGMKSYGRAPTFLMATGYEQVRAVVAALAADGGAAPEPAATDLFDGWLRCAWPVAGQG